MNHRNNASPFYLEVDQFDFFQKNNQRTSVIPSNNENEFNPSLDDIINNNDSFENYLIVVDSRIRNQNQSNEAISNTDKNDINSNDNGTDSYNTVALPHHLMAIKKEKQMKK